MFWLFVIKNHTRQLFLFLLLLLIFGNEKPKLFNEVQRKNENYFSSPNPYFSSVKKRQQ